MNLAPKEREKKNYEMEEAQGPISLNHFDGVICM